MAEQFFDHVPKYKIRWLRPAYSTALLDLPTAPVAAANLDAWRAFTEEESVACEEAWQNLPEDQRLESGEGVVSPKPPSDDGASVVEDEDDVVGVAIYNDKLYEVDVRAMQLKPVYWALTGSPCPVMRAHWMYDDTHPVPEPLNSQLEKAYRSTKPWLAMYAEELRAALLTGTSEAHDKLKRPLDVPDETLSVVFQDGTSGRIVSENLAFRVQQSLYASFMSNRPIAFPGATPVYRGYEAAEKGTNSGVTITGSKPTSRSASVDRGQTRSPSKSHARHASLKINRGEEQELVHTDEPTKTGEESGEITDLVFIVHGIGQNLAHQYENLNFTYATNLFRQVCRKQSASPALSSLMRSNRLQFLPLQWRMSFSLDGQELLARQEEGLDNRFALEDITIQESIPFIRDLANNVILDVPYFMSGHKERMLQSVCSEANTIYRKWCKRNPGFDTKGRVHLIAHSLGSALVTNILSNQPTHVVPFSQLPPAERDPKGQFLFDTSNLFLAGSPLAVFMLIEQRQMIARKGRERTMAAKSDEALDRQGLFGCLSVDSIYNVFYPSDPVAYRLNSVVDQKRALVLPPSAITAINASFFGKLTKLFTLPPMPSMTLPAFPALPAFRLPFTSSNATTPPESEPEQEKETEKEKPSSPLDSKANFRPPMGLPKTSERRGSMPGTPREKERARLIAEALRHPLTVSSNHPKHHGRAAHHENGEDERDARARRRFLALNPHGTLDFYLPGEGAISEYIDMVTAHLNYWSDSAFAAFVLAEIFANREDRLRTGNAATPPDDID